ncbi:hypothetical protein DFH09DRAFT_1084401 [Mycena vulgaris]|nr:hypothetical protein DFH09DRAFT_1084401 [Mycena vulgaris]
MFAHILQYNISPGNIPAISAISCHLNNIKQESPEFPDDSNCKGRAMYRIGAVRALLVSERQSWTQSRAREEGDGVARSKCELPTVRHCESPSAAFRAQAIDRIRGLPVASASRRELIAAFEARGIAPHLLSCLTVN